MKRRFRTELRLTQSQKTKFFQTRGVCRYIYNMFIAYNQERHKNGEPYLSAKSFSVWLNNKYLPNHPEKHWIKEVYSKAVKQSLEDAHKAFMRFFQGKSAFPNYKKRGRNEPSMYFVKNNKTDCYCERHRIKVPSLGFVQLKEKGYLPTTKDRDTISSGAIEYIAGKFYISVVVEVPKTQNHKNENHGIGIDLGIKDFAILSNGKKYKNINKTVKVKKLEKKLKREQRRLSRKYENKKKGGATQGKNIQKQRENVQKIYHQLANIRDNYVKTTVSEIVKTKPSFGSPLGLCRKATWQRSCHPFITIENLNVTGMMKNRHLSKAIQQQKFYAFRRILTEKCKENDIELRIVDRWFPSSKICHCCGQRKKELKLSDRMYQCDCGYMEDRDLNASLNLRDATMYHIA